ncbi:MAG: Apocarotenoid-15,15'-oxygenase [Oscillatoriales cyanobacterium]|nr:MAG: Apocarotenoid-15,15'-oxygenase [Oscillatoriales cyanobacterium]
MIVTTTPTPLRLDPSSYRRDDWQRGYQSQRQESAQWLSEDAIEGTIPPELNGTFFRNGPGLLDIGGTPIAHPFDGDGMINAIALTNGRAHFQNRYVRTAGFVAEQNAGKLLYRGVFGTQKPGGWLANIFDTNFKNIANTNVIYWGGKLLALWEGSQPHRLDPKTLETISLEDLDGTLAPGEAFAAHPRVDPACAADGGQPCLVNFGVKAGLSSTIHTFEFAPDGTLLRRHARSIPGFAFMHDMAITPRYSVFCQNPVTFNPLPMLLGFSGAGACIKFDPKSPTKIYLLPRDGGELEIYETDPCFIFHHANAYESGEEMILDSICYANFPTVEENTSYLDVDFDALPPGELWRFRINRSTGQVRRTVLESRCCEFPSLHPDRVGRPYRYLYSGAAAQPSGNAPLQAVIKLDLEADSTPSDRQIYSVAPRGFTGEPVFVPRPGGTAEDDGWLLLLVYESAQHRSSLHILKAQDIEAGPIAKLNLPYHIPYGLHGSFTPEVFIPAS